MPYPDLTPYECATLWIQGVGVIVVAVYTRLTWRQAKALHESNETSRQALEETRRSNERTAESNRIQREAMVTANRAWLGPGGLERLAPLNSTATGLSIVLRNSGRSPATKVVGKSGIALKNQPLAEVPEIEPAGTPTSIPVVFPESATSTTLAFGAPQLTDEEVRAVKEGKAFLYYFGVFTYEDAFNNTRETHVCVYYSAASGSWDHTPFGNLAT